MIVTQEGINLSVVHVYYIKWLWREDVIPRLNMQRHTIRNTYDIYHGSIYNKECSYWYPCFKLNYNCPLHSNVVRKRANYHKDKDNSDILRKFGIDSI